MTAAVAAIVELVLDVARAPLVKHGGGAGVPAWPARAARWLAGDIA